MLGFVLAVAQAAALSAAPVQCEIRAEQSEGDTVLVGLCGESAVVLGSATSHEIYANAQTGTAVAVIGQLDQTQVLLVRPGAEGRAFQDDLTPSLARLYDRVSDAGLSGLVIDMEQYATDGLIGVRQADMSDAPRQLSVVQIVADSSGEETLPGDPAFVPVGLGQEQPGEGQ